MNKVLILALCMILSIGSATAQKYGHLNFGTLISLMPDSEAADKKLEDFQKGLVAAGEEMANAFQTDYKAFVAEVQGGDLTPVQQGEKEKVLRAKQQEIVAYERDITKQLGEKRDELLAPIIEKAQAAVAAIAKEKGFQMVFDTSMFNSVLFAAETEDLMPLVMDRLGIKKE